VLQTEVGAECDVRYTGHLTVLGAVARFFSGMTVIAAEIDDDEVVIGFDGRAQGGALRPARDDAIKAAPLNSLWAIAYLGSTAFMEFMAADLWGPSFFAAPEGLFEKVHSLGKKAFRADLEGDIAIDAVELALQKHKPQMLRFAPNDCLLLAGLAESGPTIITWAGADQYKRSVVEETYGKIHFIGTPWGVGPCAKLVQSGKRFEERFAAVLEPLAALSSGGINENVGIIRFSDGWAVSGRPALSNSPTPDPSASPSHADVDSGK
jgi:hypothetical protein